MNEPLFAGQAFDERAKVFYGANYTFVGLADFYLACHKFHFRYCAFHAFFACGVYADFSGVVVVDVYLRSGVFRYAADIFASGAD